MIVVVSSSVSLFEYQVYRSSGGLFVMSSCSKQTI